MSPEIREHAAIALGAAASANPDLGRELLRGALWALNDESATNGSYMLPAIGEIGRQAPDLVAPFVGPMTSFMWDESLRPGILNALCLYLYSRLLTVKVTKKLTLGCNH